MGTKLDKISIKMSRYGANPAKNLIDQIIAFARKKGIEQAALAGIAGISPESLSRLKRKGGCRLATALELAMAAGLKVLDLTGRSATRGAATRGAASVAAGKLSAGRRLPITVEDLVMALACGESKGEHRAHLVGFFEELSIESVHDVVLDEGLDYQRLLLLAREIGAEGETVDWLEEMACNGVA